MVEYGFETGTNKCAAKYCLNKQAIKDFDDVMAKAGRFGTKLRDSSIYALRKASCHPKFEEYAPKVEWFWQLFPLNFLAYNPLCFLLTGLTDLGTLLCCWPFWLPW